MSARRYVLSSTPRNVSPWITWGAGGFFCLILLAVLITFSSQVRGPTRLAIDAGNLRQIGQAVCMYAEDNEGRLPENNLGADGRPADGEQTTVHRYAIALARDFGLNDSGLFISTHDEHPRVHSDWREWSDRVIIRRDPDGLIYHPDFPSSRERRDRQEIEVNPQFLGTGISFQLIGGLTDNLPATTPIGFTRGLREDGRWDSDNAVYGSRGGHIVFLDGRVVYRRTLRSGEDRLETTGGEPTRNILETLTSNQAIYGAPDPPIPEGTRGIGGSMMQPEQ